MKKIIAILIALMVVMMPAVAFAEEGKPVNAENAAEISIDDKNIYEGMEKSYSSGYVPIVKDGKATIVLPLKASRDIGKLTVTPNLGDPLTAPFVFKSYQKTVSMSTQTTSKDKEMDIYYIRFDLSLKKDRYNGTYPVTIDVSGGDYMNTFTCYVTITDGKNMTEEMPEETPESQPILIVSGSTVAPETPTAGEEFTVEVDITNTDKSKSVKNMTVKVTTSDPALVLQEETDTFYFEKFAAGATEKLTLKCKSGLSIAPGRYSIDLAMSYDNADAMTLSSGGSVKVNIVQPLRVEVTLPTIAEHVSAGDTLPLTFQIMNLGRSNVYNVRCEMDVPGLIPSGSAFAGNMAAGTSVTCDVNVFVGTKDMSKGYEGTDKYGQTSGVITLIYEDEEGQEYTETFDISTTIGEPYIAASTAEEEAELEAKENQWWIAVAIAAVVIIAIGAFLIIKKRKSSNEA